MNTTRLPSLFTPEPFVFDDAFRSFMRPFRWDPTPDTPTIPMEVVEMDDCYVVTAWIPGVKKDDIHVEIEGRQVMITTDYKMPEYEKKDLRFLRGEISYGFASRVFTLGYEIDRTIEACRAVATRRGDDLLIVPLHGSLLPDPLGPTNRQTPSGLQLAARRPR